MRTAWIIARGGRKARRSRVEQGRANYRDRGFHNSNNLNMAPSMSATINSPAVSAENAQYKLWCIVEDDNTPFLVTVPTNARIAELKDLVCVKRMSILRGVDAAGLDLWKVSHFQWATGSTQLDSYHQPDEYVPVDPEGALLKRIKTRFDGKDLRNIAARLSNTKRVLGIFPEQPPEKYLHIYVRRSAACESLALHVRVACELC
jgi:hypothetical protein